MKQVVSEKTPCNQIALKDIDVKHDSLIVMIYDNSVYFLTVGASYTNGKDAGFRRIAYDGDANSCRRNPSEAIEMNLNSPAVKLYQFDSLQELAQAIIDNGWK